MVDLIDRTVKINIIIPLEVKVDRTGSGQWARDCFAIAEKMLETIPVEPSDNYKPFDPTDYSFMVEKYKLDMSFVEILKACGYTSYKSPGVNWSITGTDCGGVKAEKDVYDQVFNR